MADVRLDAEAISVFQASSNIIVQRPGSMQMINEHSKEPKIKTQAGSKS
jgi:hypothetical protein